MNSSKKRDDISPTPVITYPADGDTDVPLTSTIEWEPLSDIDGLSLEIEGVSGIRVEVNPDTTSFTLPIGVL